MQTFKLKLVGYNPEDETTHHRLKMVNAEFYPCLVLFVNQTGLITHLTELPPQTPQIPNDQADIMLPVSGLRIDDTHRQVAEQWKNEPHSIKPEKPKPKPPTEPILPPAKPVRKTKGKAKADLFE